MSKFKVGDRVRAISAGYGWDTVEEGDIGVVVWANPNRGSVDYRVDFPNRTQWNAYEADLESVTDYQTIEPKLGDKFRVVKHLKSWIETKDNGERYPLGFITEVIKETYNDEFNFQSIDNIVTGVFIKTATPLSTSNQLHKPPLMNLPLK